MEIEQSRFPISLNIVIDLHVHVYKYDRVDEFLPNSTTICKVMGSFMHSPSYQDVECFENGYTS